jgi:hypothetical protein
MPTMPRSIQVSPRHHVALSDDYLRMIDKAPSEDFVVRTLARKQAGSTTLMMGELVIAGASTRAAYELAREYPLHFRKTYYPGGMHGDPRTEFDLHRRASHIVPVPPPIGATRETFRSCLLPGTPLNRLSALGTEPDEANIKTAAELTLSAAAGLWRLTEEALVLLTRMQDAGLTHGDAHLHNFIACPSPLEVLPIDFEIAVLKEEVEPSVWALRCQNDRQHLLKLAVFLQCALGQQKGPLAQESMANIERLVRPSGTFREVIAERTFDASITG